MTKSSQTMPVFDSLDTLTRLVTGRRGLYVRWSRGPEQDLRDVSSTDDLTGVPLPGLSASPLDMEEWWGERPPHVWVARRLHDYCHLPRVKGAGTRPWVLHGTEAARGRLRPVYRSRNPMTRRSPDWLGGTSRGGRWWRRRRAVASRRVAPWGFSRTIFPMGCG
jgi:hypothetical protein